MGAFTTKRSTTDFTMHKTLSILDEWLTVVEEAVDLFQWLAN